MWSDKISTFIVKKYLKGLLIRKGLVGSLYMSVYFSKSINNIKRFFTDIAGDYKPIGCVAATLNNSVLHKTHISCDDTVKYFVCKQSEYFYGYVLTVFANYRLCTVCGIFSDIVKNLQYNKCYKN